MDNGVILPIKGGRLLVDGVGIHLKPWLATCPITVPWSNISFVCATPGVERRGAEWHTFEGEPVTAKSLRGGLSFYTLMPALKDRHIVTSGYSLLMNMWLRRAVWVRPLKDADDKAHPNQGFMELRLSRRGIRSSPKNLIETLDLIEKYSRFDLIVFDL